MYESIIKHDSIVNRKWLGVWLCNRVINIRVDNSTYASWWLSHATAWVSPAHSRITNHVPKYSKGKVTLDKRD